MYWFQLPCALDRKTALVMNLQRANEKYLKQAPDIFWHWRQEDIHVNKSFCRHDYHSRATSYGCDPLRLLDFDDVQYTLLCVVLGISWLVALSLATERSTNGFTDCSIDRCFRAIRIRIDS